MEEKLRNLSQNIANNTGPREADEPEDRHEDHFEEDDSREYQDEHNNERIDMDSSYADDIQDSQEAEEPEENHDEDVPEEEVPADDDKELESVEEQEEPSDDADSDEHHEEEHEEEQPEPEPSEEDLADIDSEPEEPHHEEEPSSEPSSHAAKYSPEVEAALSRLNPEENSEEMSEPLSTEPHKKKHHAGPIFLFILFILAIAAVSICILVEQKIIENPFPNLFKKSEPTSEVQPKEDVPSEPVQEYIKVDEWGVKIIQPEGVSTFWYDNVEGDVNRIRIYGADEDYIPDATTSQGANVVAEVIRSTESTFQYNEDLTLSPTTSLSGYYYYMVIIYGDIEDELFQIFQDELLDNETAILAL